MPSIVYVDYMVLGEKADSSKGGRAYVDEQLALRVKRCSKNSDARKHLIACSQVCMLLH